ncbi:hypothetical protein Psch_03205 [Pelotomaculum schinkii]|uniref:Uncharacterized protein n=1 Tax=Pelotomaculum schinkii TaxID=78350 RepID=A0A4Y7RBR6_9FIRM|nr:exodeoxyribonuclease VII small subunit [Pelotomaculum schinkii]TEB06161.1 hypothetical protein Psch_03205 [Pelotomaculum schinkii]
MDNEQFQRLVLEQLKALTDGQKGLEQSVKSLEQGQKGLDQSVKSLEQGQKALEQGQAEIKNELKYIWADIKKIDSRLSTQEEEVVILKRLK